MTESPLTFAMTLAAPVERVFAALTEARHLVHWFCDECESDARAGGELITRWSGPGASPQPFVAHWIAFDPPASASFEGGHSGYPSGSAGTVRFTLAASPEGGTRLVVTHETTLGPEHAAMLEGWRAAWPRAQDRLRVYLTAGAADANFSTRRFERYVALGDSSTEGIADGDPRTGYRGWSRRLVPACPGASD